MPRVPTQFDNQVQLRPVTQERFQAVDAAQGLGTAGAALQKAGSSLLDKAVADDQTQAIYDEARAKNGDNLYQPFATDTLFGKDGFYTKQNADALNARAGVEKALRDKRDELLKQTQTSRERAMLQQVLDKRINSDLEGIGRYAQGQAKSYAQLQSNTRISNAQDNYARYIDDPARSGMEMATIEGEIRNQAQANGLQDAGVISAMMFDAKSKAHQGVVESKALNDPYAASAYLDKHRDEIDTRTQLNLDRQLHPVLVEQDAKASVEAALSIGTPGDVVEGPSGQPVILQSPIPGAKSSGYGWRTDPINGTKKFHQGQDIPAPRGAPAGAAGAGTVMFAGNRNDGYGNQVLIQHPDGTETRYAHLDAINVKAKDKVDRGTTIGQVGSTGRSTGPHLHFEVITPQGQHVDPTTMVGKTVGNTGGQSPAMAKDDLGAQLDYVTRDVNARYADKSPAYRGQVLDAAKAEVERRWSMNRRVENERFNNEGDAAWRSVDALGDNFTSISQIPNYGRLSPDAQHQFRVIARRNAEGGNDHTTPVQVWTKISDAYASDPSEFLKIRPEQAQSVLSKEDYRTYLGWRRDALSDQANGGKTPQWLTEKDIMAQSKQLMEASGLHTGEGKQAEADAPRVRKFTNSMLDWSRSFKAQNGRLPNTDEIRKQSDQMLIQGTWMDKNAWFMSTKGLAFERPSDAKDWQATVPPDIHRQIKSAAPNASEDQVRQIYVQGVQGGKW